MPRIFLTTNYLTIYSLCLIGCLFFSQACSHKPIPEVKTQSPQILSESSVVKFRPLEDPVTLKNSGEPGRVELVNNCSLAITRTFDKEEIRHKKIEAVDFKVQTTTTKVLKNSNIIQNIQTIWKDGFVNLHDLAYPELGEIMEVESTRSGEIKKAGNYPKTSIFFLPPLPLPKKPVNVGEEWKSEHSWKSEENGLPLKVSIVSKYLGSKQCGDFACAEISVKGEVHMPAAIEKKNGFMHKLSGRFLFEPKRGLLVWAEFGSDEAISAGGARAEVRSTLRSELILPLGYRTTDRGEPTCPIETKEE
ncbi:MAG: hypothetical protein SGI74_10125 [Oligoflexia bacterium]|nr:hypothetical protein [Oligoflexia bacterium]